MFERFTEQARQVVALAQEEARLMRHAHIGTEHLLVALARVDDDIATPMLAAHGLTGERARAEVVAIEGVGNADPGGQLPLTPAAQDALDATLRESLELGHDRIEPAHLLLGVLRQRDGVARRVLAGAGANPPEARADVVERLQRAGLPPHEPRSPRADGELLLQILERDGAVAAWLRERGIDEGAVRRMLGEG
jgi:ATP-dependent Clp protease ATP-binding subunit ClpA